MKFNLKEIAKIITPNASDWEAGMGKANKVIKYIKKHCLKCKETLK